ncbi:MAG: hypothetical protein AAFR96_01720 [Planctomycetota bacterium]
MSGIGGLLDGASALGADVGGESGEGVSARATTGRVATYKKRADAQYSQRRDEKETIDEHQVFHWTARADNLTRSKESVSPVGQERIWVLDSDCAFEPRVKSNARFTHLTKPREMEGHYLKLNLTINDVDTRLAVSMIGSFP